MEIIASEPMTVKKYTYDGFRKIELTNNLSCESYTAFTTQSSRYPLFFLGMYLTKKPSTLSKLGVAFEFSQGKSGLIKE
jgi:hypothetical protein